MELRREIRYRLDASAVFSWEGLHRRRFQGEGITRDVSVQGAFILTTTVPPPDSTVQVDLLLPSIDGLTSMMRVTGKAKVIRLDCSPSNSWVRGFAVVTDDFNQWGLVNVDDEPPTAVAVAARAH